MKRFVLLVATVCLLAACSRDDEQALAESPKPHTAKEVHWGYAGEEGPGHWADLSDEFAVCASGLEQSPIDLASPKLTNKATWTERIGDNVLTEGQRARVMDLVDNGHTIQVTNDVPMVAVVDGEKYELVQYHFHGAVGAYDRWPSFAARGAPRAQVSCRATGRAGRPGRRGRA